MKGAKGKDTSCSKHWPDSVKKPLAVAFWLSSATRRLLPMPASPAKMRHWPLPSCVAARARSRRSISRSRPTSMDERIGLSEGYITLLCHPLHLLHHLRIHQTGGIPRVLAQVGAANDPAHDLGVAGFGEIGDEFDGFGL